MARRQANVYLTIWNDPDFLTLSPDAKLLYFVLLTHPTLTYCGVADWREKRLATMTGGMTVESLRHAAWELGQKRMIAVDPDTEEVLVRSFVRHDGGLKQPNTAKGMVREYGTIMSLKLRELVTLETRRAVDENPDWKGIAEVGSVTKQFPDSTGGPSVFVPEGFRLGSIDPSANPSIDPSLDPSPDPLNTSTSTSTSTYVERPASSEAPALSTPKRKAPRTPLPASWEPKPRHAEKAREIQRDLDTEAEKFRNDAQANDRRYVLWDRAFDNWLIRSVDWSAPSAAPKRIVTAGEIPDDW